MQKGNPMRPRALASAGATALGAVTAIVTLVLGTTAGYAEAVPSSAYGIAAEGPIPIEPTPYVESSGAREQSSALTLPDNPLLALEAAAVSAAAKSASVKLVDLSLAPGTGLPAQLAPLNTAFQSLLDNLKPACEAENPAKQVPEAIGDLLPSQVVDQLDPEQLCASITTAETPSLVSIGLIKVACDEESGSVEIANVAMLGQQIEIPPLEANTAILPENPLVSITANKQTNNEDGSFTVVGLEINLGDGQEVITAASATCGVPDKPEITDPPTAPPPTPVTTGLPVTG